MGTDLIKKDVKYLNKDFAQFRRNLIHFAKNYFPQTYNDFNETSPGMMFIEMAAYVGDVLSYYTDTTLRESLVSEANEKANAEANATLEQNNSNMNLSSGGYGKEVEGIDASQSVFSNSTLDPNLTTDPTGASTTGSTAVAKKLGEVKPYYENLKMSAAQYKKAAAMMTVSGVSSLNKKGCYKPK